MGLDVVPEQLTKTQFWLLVPTIYLTMTMMGLTEMSGLVALPMMKHYFDVDSGTWGLFNSILSCCYLTGSLLASFILKYLGFKVMFLSAFVMDIAGCILLQYAKTFWTAASCIIVIWISTGLYEISTNSASTATFKKHTATLMMLMQCCFGIGGTLSPIVSAIGLRVFKHDFYSCYLAIAIVVGVVMIFVAVVPIPIHFDGGESSLTDKPSSSDHFTNNHEVCMNSSTPMSTPMSTSTSTPAENTIMPSADYTWWNTLSSRTAWICALSLGMMEAVEVGSNVWAPLYLIEVLKFDVEKDLPVFGSWLQIFFTISRGISGPIIDYLGYYTSLYLANIGCALLLVVGFLLGRAGIYCFVLTSFFYAWFWPTNICASMGIFKNNAPLVTSHMIVMQTILTIPISTILGKINHAFGDQWAYRLLLVFSVLALIAVTLMRAAHRRLMREEKEEKKEKLLEQTEPVVVN